MEERTVVGVDMLMIAVMARNRLVAGHTKMMVHHISMDRCMEEDQIDRREVALVGMMLAAVVRNLIQMEENCMMVEEGHNLVLDTS